MPGRIGGKAVAGGYIGGKKVAGALIDGDHVFSAAQPDSPGTLAVAVTLTGRDYNFVFSVTDTDGIRSLTAATVTASDGRQASALADFTRSDANTFAGTDSRRNARWASGTMSVTYVEARTGETRTLSQPWS